MVLLDSDNLDTKSLSISTDILKKSVVVKKPLPSLGVPIALDTNSNLGSILDKIDQTDKDYDTNSTIDGVDEFEKNVKLWIEFDDKVAEYKKTMDTLVKERNKYKKTVMDFMKIKNLGDIEVSSCKILFNKNEKPETLTDKILREKLVMYFTNQSQADAIHNFIKSNLKSKETFKLERIKK